MSHNYWTSSQCIRWCVDKKSLKSVLAKDVHLTTNKLRALQFRYFFLTFIRQLGAKLKLRQRVIATAQVYFKRVYMLNGLSQYDPRLTAPTMLFIAAKCDETPVNAKVVVNATASLIYSCSMSSDKMEAETFTANIYPYSVADLLCMEYVCLHLLTFDLIVYHPYDTLLQLITLIPQQQQAVTECAWAIINDSYYSDLCLLHPPALIAVAALYIACQITQCEYRTFIQTMAISQQTLIELSEELLLVYQRFESQEGAGAQSSSQVLSPNLTQSVTHVSVSNAASILHMFDEYYRDKPVPLSLKFDISQTVANSQHAEREP